MPLQSKNIAPVESLNPVLSPNSVRVADGGAFPSPAPMPERFVSNVQANSNPSTTGIRRTTHPQFVEPAKALPQRAGMTFKQKVTLGVALGLTGVGLTYFLYNKYWVVQERRERADSLEDGTASSYANRLQMAFDNDGWWGTNVPAVRRVLLDIPNADLWKGVIKSYRNITKGSDLLTDMQDELTTTEWLEMQAIFSTLPAGSGSGTLRQFNPLSIAKRINAAIKNVWFGFWEDVDNDAVDKALEEVPTKRDWRDVATSYLQEFSVRIEDDLNAALWKWYGEDWEAVIQAKPDQ